MYLYCARQSRLEFSALETSSIAISFLRGSSRPVPDDGVAVEVAAEDGCGPVEVADGRPGMLLPLGLGTGVLAVVADGLPEALAGVVAGAVSAG
ncbi:hypothetical protein GCM10009838_67430 [Catenulispora subtropica]|uniref:Uncharacterized protein n=1 Tax=Catenulispora subtropica TaxID=450798 RepID=A0ABN2SWH3_9ACTN